MTKQANFFFRHCKIVIKWFLPGILLMIGVNFIAEKTGLPWIHYLNFITYPVCAFFAQREVKPLNLEMRKYYIDQENARSEAIRREYGMPSINQNKKNNQ